MSRIILCTLFGLVLSSYTHAQEDDTWWKKMFKKETVKEMEADSSVVAPLDPHEATDLETSEPAATDTVIEVPTPVYQRGDVEVLRNAALDSLDRAMIRNPKPINGYRIQVYFGNLQQAKQIRGNLMMENHDLPCYLESNAPNFAVRIGNYRTEFDAYKDLVELRERFPQAHIVRSEIELPELHQ